MSESKIPPASLVTPEGRLAFPALSAPKPRSKDKPNILTYQAVLLLPPKTDLRPFQRCVITAMQAKWGKVIQLPASKNPIHSCSEKPDLAGYEDGWHYINMHSKFQPAVVDRGNVPVDLSTVYPGMWVRVFTNAWAWEHGTGGKGVSFGLNAIQILRDGERLDGRVQDMSLVFEPLEGDSSAGEDDENPFG